MAVKVKVLFQTARHAVGEERNQRSLSNGHEIVGKVFKELIWLWKTDVKCQFQGVHQHE